MHEIALTVEVVKWKKEFVLSSLIFCFFIFIYILDNNNKITDDSDGSKDDIKPQL